MSLTSALASGNRRPPSIGRGRNEDFSSPTGSSEAAILGDFAADGGYQLVVVPNVRLEKVYLSLAKVGAVGQRPEGAFIKQQEALTQRVYPTQRPIQIELSGFGGAGIYFVEVTATRADGRPVTMDPMWIYHTGAGQ